MLDPEIILNIAECLVEIEPLAILSLLLTSKVCRLPRQTEPMIALVDMMIPDFHAANADFV